MVSCDRLDGWGSLEFSISSNYGEAGQNFDPWAEFPPIFVCIKASSSPFIIILAPHLHATATVNWSGETSLLTTKTRSRRRSGATHTKRTGFVYKKLLGEADRVDEPHAKIYIYILTRRKYYTTSD